MKAFPTTSSRNNPDSSAHSSSVVIYENNGNLILGMVTGSKKEKLRVLNIKGSEIELAANRLYHLPGGAPSSFAGQKDRILYLEKLWDEALVKSDQVELETIWESFDGSTSEIAVSEITELFYGNNELVNHLSIRISLHFDTLYFKRNKETFTVRTKDTVAALLREREAALVKEQELEEFINILRTAPLSPEKLATLSPTNQNFLELLEDLAVGATEGSDTKEARDLCQYICEKLELNLSGHPEERALSLLKSLGIFNNSTNLALIKYRPRINFPDNVSSEADNIAKSFAIQNLPPRLDLTHLNTFTIDDISTKDMDDGLSIEQTENGFTIGIHISDVSAVVTPDTYLDREAKLRGTSIYCPESTIHMLPPSMSQKLLSLVQGQTCPTISYLINLNHDFDIIDYKIVEANIKVTSRYNYDQVDALILNSEQASQQNDIPVNDIQNLLLLNEIANKLEVDRIDGGAVRVNRKDVSININKDGTLSLGEYDEASPARSLVGEMMILANHISADFTLKAGVPFIYRTQPDSDVDPFSNPNNIPTGPAYDFMVRLRLKRSSITVDPGRHSSLGLSSYTQVTSPIRRYLDLCAQRQLAEYLRSKNHFYTKNELNQIIVESETPLTNAKFLSQESKRFWILKYLQQELKNSPTIGATVIRNDLKNPIAQLDTIFITTPINIQRKVALGEHVTLRITSINPHRDFIKFEEA